MGDIRGHTGPKRAAGVGYLAAQAVDGSKGKESKEESYQCVFCIILGSFLGEKDGEESEASLFIWKCGCGVLRTAGS
jgi:hypothetical protein